MYKYVIKLIIQAEQNLNKKDFTEIEWIRGELT